MPELRGIPVAVDDGYAQVKIWSPKGEFVYATSVRSGESRIGSLDGVKSGGSYRTGDEIFSVSDSVAADATAYDGYHASPLNRVSVHHGLHMAGFGGKEVALFLGLPIREFYRSGETNKEASESKRRSFSVPVLPLHDALPVEIVRVRIFPQAVAAWVDAKFDANMRPQAGFESDAPMAVVDIGGRTTDVAVLLGKDIDHARTGTENVGMISVREMLEEELKRQFGIEQKLPVRHLDGAIRSGTIILWGEKHDVAENVKAARGAVAGKISRFVRRMLGDAADLSTVLFVGGGANFFEDLPQTFRNAKRATAPEFANARGIWKLGRNRDAMDLLNAK
ncbi:MAG: ParM/StbA family protein [Azospirillum sp.]|nr:ParM/StbA family protein [Azospirillum sp.]